METGTSFIAEIPNPDCVAGKKGDPSVPSQFAAQLKSARDKFEARFPGGAGTDSELGGIPVILTGIAFYDRPHRQTGRAVNGIELHPLLDIQFDNGSPAPPGTVQPPVGSEITQLLANPGFESGVSAWSGTLEDIGSFGNVPAHQGSNLAWMGGTGSAHTESLYQNVHVPSATPQVALSFWFRIETEETTTTHAYDKFYVQIRDKNGKVLKTLATFSNLDQTSGFVQKTFDVSGYAGQDIQVFFKAVEDEGKISSFWLDDVTLTVQ
jgi:hypothetical protein